MGSFDSINYSIRPNKSVERKLIADVLSTLATTFSISDYRYTGFGSMWFSDFILFHRALGINSMVSIEGDRSRADRVKFNLPFKCIQTTIGFSSDVLKTMKWDAENDFVWLDYDTGIFSPWKADTALIASKIKSGAILAITLNAENRQLEDEYKARDVVLREQLGDLISPSEDLKPRLRADHFPSFVCECVTTHLRRVSKEVGSDLEFEPLFDLEYKDGAPMITVGGMFLNSEDRVRFKQTRFGSRFPYLSSHFIIDVPPLTPREKLKLDSLLPRASAITIKELGFTLKTSHIESYRLLYRYYPDYREVFA